MNNVQFICYVITVIINMIIETNIYIYNYLKYELKYNYGAKIYIIKERICKF